MKVLIQRINPKISRKIKKKDNLEWINKKLYQVFSENVSVKCTLYNKEHNKHEIDKIFKENKAIEIIDILNKSIGEMLYKFTNNIRIDGLETLEDDLNNIKKKMIEKGEEKDIDRYLEYYKNIALNLENIFIRKRGRNKKNH